MSKQETMTIFYDASCPFCSQEIHNIKLYDDHNQMVLVDCSAQEFDDRGFASENITRHDMMNAMHIRDHEGRWFKGVEAFEVMYEKAGFKRIAKMCGHPVFKPVAVWVYPWIVKNRYLLSKLGMVQFLALWGKLAARSANKRAAQCKDDSCKIG